MLPSLFYTADVKHAHDLAAVLRSHGVRVYPVSGRTPTDERRRLIGMFRAGEIDGLASCQVLGEAFDAPIAMGAFMARPFLSGLLYRQAVGRVLRRYPGVEGERGYQQQMLASVLGDLRENILDLLVVMVTGSGKTYVSSRLPGLIRQWKPRPRGRMMFLVHLDELAQQSADTFAKNNPGLKVGIEKADAYAGDADIVIASVQTIGRKDGKRIQVFRPGHFDGVVTDECHHSTAAQYRNIYRYMGCDKSAGRDGEMFHLGITATPNRTDNVGLEHVFTKISFEYGLRQAIKEGWLCSITAHRVETHQDISMVPVRGEDFTVGALEDAINTPTRNRIVAEKYLEVCRLEGMEGVSDLKRWKKPHATVVDFCDSSQHSLITVPTLVGLPPRYDTKGRDLITETEEIEAAEAEHPGLNLRAEPTIESVRATLRSIDLLQPPFVPPEIAAHSRMPWLYDGPEAYHLGLMDHSMLSVRQNVLGAWEVFRHHRGRAERLTAGRTLKEAVTFAEKYVPARAKPALNTGARWRGDPPTREQTLKLWQVDHRIRRQFPESGDFFLHCERQYRASGECSKGVISDRITAALKP